MRGYGGTPKIDQSKHQTGIGQGGVLREMQNEYKLAVRKNSNHHQWEISEVICSREDLID